MRATQRIRNRDRDSGTIFPARNLLWADLVEGDDPPFFIPESPDDGEDPPRCQGGFDTEN
jgi:hypothetical protein